ncbi:unnamed protein product [Durusdinium trenchii]|uniref:Uncharacterized protein n=1 Tax=Durusdinium trenchii TaxID=1381693 RepID=A0ABP0HEZ2_9DINO
MKRDLESVPVVRGVLMGCCLRSKSLPSGSPWLAFALLVAVAHRTGTFCGGAPLLFKRSGRTFAAGRLATDPNFAANVGEATETVRSDHAQIPRLAPGLNVADPRVSLEIAQVSALRFSGLTQYREFWDNFRSGVELVSASAISEVVNVVQSGLYLRVRWRLIMKPKDVFSGALGGVQAAQGAFGNLRQAVPKDLPFQANDFFRQAEQWTSQASAAAAEAARDASEAERVVEFNSIYELDCWSGRIVKHTLEFRSPEENFDLLGTLAGMPAR